MIRMKAWEDGTCQTAAKAELELYCRAATPVDARVLFSKLAKDTGSISFD